MTDLSAPQRAHREPSPRMRQVLDAAVVVTADAGLRGLTHRAVDAQSGLPIGSTSAYLRTRLALVSALTDHVAASLNENVSEMLAQLAPERSDEEIIDLAIELFVRWLDDPRLMLTRLQLEGEALRQPEVGAIVNTWRIHLTRNVAEILAQLGVEDAEVHAQAIIAALNGVMLDAMTRPEGERVPYVRAISRVIIGAFVGLRGPEEAGRR